MSANVCSGVVTSILESTKTLPPRLILAEVIDVPVGRDGPENVSGINAAQLGRAWQILNTQLDASAAAPGAFHLRLTFQARQQSRPTKFDCNRFVQRISYGYGLTFDVLLGNCDEQRRVDKR
jgi:hypothetical protein